MDIGTLYVRRATFIEAQPHKVWAYFTSFEKLSAWFGHGHQLCEFDANEGGTVRLSVEIENKTTCFGGRITNFETGRELSFENNWEGQLAWPVPTYITLRLTRMYSGTLVELFHHGFERLGKDAADVFEGYEAGWSSHHLERLRALVTPSAP